MTNHQLTAVHNYHDWCKTITLYLHSIDKDNHMTGNTPQGEKSKAWLRDNARLFLQIRNSIEGDVLGLINHCETVKELMEYLEFFYYGKKNISRIYDVRKAFYCAEKYGKSLTAYFMDFKKIYEELNKLMPFSSNIKVQQQQREQMAVMSFLARLPPEFESSKSQILTSYEEFSLADVFSLVIRAEQSPTTVQIPSALISKVTEYRHPRGENTNGIGVVCHYCRKPGHLKRDCRKLQYNNRRTFSAHVTSSTGGSNQSVMISANEFAKFTLYQDSLKG
ncbi:hypothetical protein LIER_34969 [Lithospermum erythrorhizon]|uniref:CCHC-type domain-containing protein n=1 Tax=Lithospermum erythrorhizon TaxID=34254 RepID=A0AAV3NH94_LITER